MHGIYDFIFVDKYLLDIRVFCLDHHILYFHLDVESLASSRGCRHHLTANRELWKVSLWRLHVLNIVLAFNFNVFMIKPLFRNHNLLNHLKNET
jgi:hypothetical protein